MKAVDNVKKQIFGMSLGGAAIFFVIVIAVAALYSVPPGHVGVKFVKFGANKGFIAEELSQGFGFKIPIKEVVWDMPFQTQTIGFFGGTEEKGTYGAIVPKDFNGINFNVDLTVRYRLDPAQASEFVEQKGLGVEFMDTLMATAARADSTRGVFGQYAQEDVPENRIEIAEEIKAEMQKRIDSEASGKLKPGFIVVEAIDIRNVDFNQKIEQRIIEKQTKLQEAQQKEYEKQIATANQEIEVINAERDKQAAIIRAEGEGESIKIVAFAKADGISAINTAYQNMPETYVAVKAFEAIKPTDKMYFGFDSLTGNQLSFLDLNDLMGSMQATGKLTTEGSS